MSIARMIGAAYAVGLVLVAGAAIGASSYPARPIRLVVPLPPAGSTDIVARLVAQKLTETWGQPVIVDNRSGAGTTIGSELVARAAPDGYTLLLTSSSLATSVSLYRMLPDVPTFTEADLPGYEVVSWSGIYVPAGTQRGIVNQLNAEINRIVQQPEARERLLSLGLVPVGGTPAALGDYLKFEIARWAKVVKAAGIKLE